MKITKKKITISILITTLAALILVTNSHANMFNRFKKGFYFEKYKTDDKNKTIAEAKEALLKLHPIGSNLDSIVKTIEKAGAKFKSSVNRKDLLSNPVREREYFPEDVSKSASIMYEYQYDTGIWLINPIAWNVIIFCDSNNIITDLYLNRDYMGL